MQQTLCPWEPSTYWFFSSNVPSLVHYSHAVAILAAFAIGLYIFLNSPRAVVPRLFFLFVLLFCFWAVLDVILWATNRPDIVMFFWSLQVLTEPLTYTVAFYLFYVFLYKRWPRFPINILIAFLLLPLILLLPTAFDLQSILISTCEAVEGPIAKYYTYIIHAILMLSIVFMAIKQIPSLGTRRERIIAVCFGFGLVTFLLSFSLGNIISSFSGDWKISEYGLFGMPIFAGFIAYSIVQFRAFNAKILTAQMLVITLAIAVVSLIALQNIDNVRIIASFTFILVCVLGYILVRSVKREIEQRQQIQILADDLKAANEKLKELDKLKSQFLSIASHDLRAPLTVVRNFISLLLDGSYGKLAPAAEEGLHQVFDRATDMAKSVDTYLNVSRIEQGRMKYDFIEIELLPLIQNAANAFKTNAEKKGLSFSFIATPDVQRRKAKLDVTKINEVLNNLFDNSIKYTPKGSITAALEIHGTVARLSIKDTGVGMSKETIGKLFQLFSTGEESRKVNTSSTGVGLYITKAHVEAHGGKVWAESEGEGKGSTFILELPLI